MAAVGSHVQEEITIGQFDDRALIHKKVGAAADFPGLAMVIGIDDVRASGSISVFDSYEAMIAGYDKTAFK